MNNINTLLMCTFSILLFFSMTINAAAGQMCAAGVTKIGSNVRHLSKPTHWLTTQYHFAFADWWTERTCMRGS